MRGGRGPVGNRLIGAVFLPRGQNPTQPAVERFPGSAAKAGRRGAVARWLACLMALLALSMWPQVASAHATVLRVEPGFDEVVQQPPTEVRIYFSEPVVLATDGLIVLAPSGRRVDLRDARIDEQAPTIARVGIEANEPGTYRVIWRAVSDDAHVVAGSYTFSIGSASEPPPETLSTVPTAWYWQALPRWIHLLALCLAGGPIVISLLLGGRLDWGNGDRSPWSLAWHASLLGIVGSILLLLVQALALAGNLAAALDPVALRATFSGRTGQLIGVRLLLYWVLYFGFAYLSMARKPKRAVLLGMAPAAAALVVVTSLTGHPATTPPVPLSVAVDALHLLATVTWLGGLLTLVPLVIKTRQSARGAELPTLLRRLLPRYSVAALVSFDVLLLTGAYQLWVNVDRPAQLVDTSYGQALLVKGLLVAILVAFGAATAWTLRDVGRAQDAALRAQSRGTRLVTIEGAIAVLLLASIGLLTALPPARTSGLAAESVPRPLSGLTLANHAGPLLATLTLSPAKPGANQVSVLVQDSRARPIDDAEVYVEVTQLGATSSTPTRVRLERASQDFRGQVVLSSSGRWSLQVAVRLPAASQEQRAKFEFEVPVPGARLILEQADAAMNRLKSVVEYSELTSGGPIVRTTAAYQAPNRLRYVVEIPGREPSTTVVVGNRRYDRVGSGPWNVSPWPGTEPFRWPDYRFAQTASAIVLLGRESVDGIECYVVSFLDPPSGARYRLWVGTTDYLIRRYEMMAVGHYMTARFDSFDDPTVRVEEPESATR